MLVILYWDLCNPSPTPNIISLLDYYANARNDVVLHSMEMIHRYKGYCKGYSKLKVIIYIRY